MKRINIKILLITAFLLSGLLCQQLFAGTNGNVALKVTVLNTTAPSITNIIPSDGSVSEIGDNISFRITANDSVILYKIAINGSTVRDWSADSTYNWDTSAKPSGVYTVSIYVKNAVDNECTQNIEIYLVKKSIDSPQL